MDTNLLHNLSYGMYIVCAANGGKLNGQIVNTLFQITSSPVTVAVSINKSNLTHEFIRSSRRFSASILLEEAPLAFIGRFGFKSGRDTDKFKDTHYKKLASGTPVILDYCLGYLEAELKGEFDCGTHTVFLGEIKESEVLKNGRPMTYDYYHQVKRGTTPASAPTFIKGEEQQTKSTARKYRCTICNYVYEPELGDPDGGIAPGTPFEKIPDDWRCPVCGVAKTKFVPLE